MKYFSIVKQIIFFVLAFCPSTSLKSARRAALYIGPQQSCRFLQRCNVKDMGPRCCNVPATLHATLQRCHFPKIAPFWRLFAPFQSAETRFLLPSFPEYGIQSCNNVARHLQRYMQRATLPKWHTLLRLT